MDLGLGDALLIFGTLLTIAAALSGLMRGTVLSISVLAVALGIGLATTGVVSVDPRNGGIVDLITLAIVLTLFSDGLFVDRELLTVHWGPVTRAIVLAMPLTLAMLGLFGKALFPDLTWAEAFLLAAVLTPTDPVVTSSVVTSVRVPENVRHTLNLESGLNDGLALPFVLFFLTFAEPTGAAAPEGLRVIGEAAFGAVVGIALGVLGGRMHDRLPGGGITARYEGIYAIGIGLAAFGLADVTFGNGLIAAFVAGVALGAVEHDIPESFVVFSENLSAISQVLTFFVFGALIVATGYDGDVWRLALFIALALLVARPAAIFASYVSSGFPRAQKAFVAWFGPKGVASMLFGLYVLKSEVPHGSLIFDVVAFTILASIVAHGLTDTVGAGWVERRSRGRAGQMTG
ncbi:MAG: sodium/hydrogen antiporter [Solirubrobacterales bacterium]|jgi:NhaP-type Na+/H+ or K+/H+ antiporter|nr:sodium/hydrogen antiporter [Solirubrobacterales bacterium]MDX6663223.1 sodium/hydrogen antiporter [Solirubrobacterales bacterium]